MKAERYRGLIIGLGTLLVAGCLAGRPPAPKTDYYTLEYTAPKFANRKPLPVVIRVERFQAAPAYSTANMVYRDGPYRQDAYHYQKWRAIPSDLVTYFLARDFQDSGLFSGVFVLGGNPPSTHLIDGTLDAFYQEIRDDRWEVVVALGITLLTEGEPDISKRIVFQKRYEARKACTHKNPQAIAEAASRAMAELSETIISDVYERLPTP